MNSFPFGSKIAVITAHPDDESYLAGGTIYANNQAGGKTLLICATKGEWGTSHLKEPMSADELKAVRQKELENACGILGVNKLALLDFPDTQLIDHSPEIIEHIVPLITDFNPEYILSFDDKGINGHLDHATIGKTATEIAVSLSIPFLQFAYPAPVLSFMKEAREKRMANGNYSDEFTTLEPDIEVSIDGEVKKRALQAHASQLEGDDPFASFADELKNVIATSEYFKLYEQQQRQL